MKILITGASGFIGSHIAEACLEAGMEVWCGVRNTSSRKYLTDERLHFLELTLTSQYQIREALEGKCFDAIVHAAGATKCRNREEFFIVNAEGTQNLIAAIQSLPADEQPQRFIMLSSLSVIYSMPESDQPTAYGESKLVAEDAVRLSELKWVILRPTGVYGPRERDYFLMVKSVAEHFDFQIGKGQKLTFIYVKDLVDAILQAVTLPEQQVVGHTFALSDGRTYGQQDFSDLVGKELGNPKVTRFTVPLWVLRVVCSLGELWNTVSPKPVVLNNDKYNILSVNDWSCDITEARKLLNFQPKCFLEEGVHLSVKWYKENKWI